jgi:hypothetical protein
MTTMRSRSSTLGQITELATPVSSSMVMNTTPAAEPGRWRTSTTPATLTRDPSRVVLRSAQDRMCLAFARSRRKDIGCAFSERRSVR